MNNWQPASGPQPRLRLPTIPEDQARATATEMVGRLAKAHLAELKAQPGGNQIVPLNTYGPATYTFRWQRVVNGVPFPANGAAVGIDGQTGQVMSYSLNWTRTEFPSAAGVISPEQALQAFQAAGMLEMQYFVAQPLRPLASGEKPLLKLVYQLHHPSGGIVDALTGKPLQLESGKWGNGGPGGMGEAEMAKLEMAAAARPAVSLTPEEQKEVEKTFGLLTQDQAVAAAKKWVDIPDNLPLRSASLQADWQSPDIRSWNLNWNVDTPAGNPKEGEVQWVNARVNAATGELLGFNLSYVLDKRDQTGAIDRQAAQKLAEDFLQQVQPQRFKEAELDETGIPFLPGPVSRPISGNPPVQSFTYRRLVGSIPFPNNNLTVTVDTVHQRITSYNLNWANLNFPEAAGTLSREQATDAFLKYQPLTLTYFQVFGPNGPEETRLVYQPTPAKGLPASRLLDAKSGEPLDWQGNPLSRQARPYYFDDIAGNYAAKEIALLGRAGIFGEYCDSFHPEEKITAISLLRAMLQAQNGVGGNANLTDNQVLEQAKQRGWLKEAMAPGATVDRQTLAILLVRLLNLDRAARVEGIYQTPYKDASAIQPSSMGYVALAWGLGILKGDGENFRPADQVTKAEAAEALVRALEIQP